MSLLSTHNIQSSPLLFNVAEKSFLKFIASHSPSLIQKKSLKFNGEDSSTIFYSTHEEEWRRKHRNNGHIKYKEFRFLA